jgi:hypothetical protein
MANVGRASIIVEVEALAVNYVALKCCQALFPAGTAHRDALRIKDCETISS